MRIQQRKRKNSAAPSWLVKMRNIKKKNYKE